MYDINKVLENTRKALNNSVKLLNSSVSLAPLIKKPPIPNSVALMNFNTNSSGNINNIANSFMQKLQNAYQPWLGTPYVWGGTSRSGVDCSGFVGNVMKSLGVSLPRTADEQFRFFSSKGSGVCMTKGQPDFSHLQPGDCIYFNTTGKGAASHTGIYIGNGKFVHASSGSKKVTISELSKDFYRTRFVGAFRPREFQNNLNQMINANVNNNIKTNTIINNQTVSKQNNTVNNMITLNQQTKKQNQKNQNKIL